MIGPTYLAALGEIVARVGGRGINWAVTGSLGFALQGVPVEPHDIDIQTDEAGAYAMERLFAECVARPVAFCQGERIRSHFGELEINGVKVEIMGAVQKRNADGSWEEPVDPQQHRVLVQVGEMRVPVLALEYEYQAYLKLGRVERAALLGRWLARRGPHGEGE